jgi:hypothetical protein
MTLKAGTEAMRAFIMKLFYWTDVARYDPDEQVRKETGQLVDLLTPLVKAYCSDFAFLLCREAIQVLGGVGYCREFPVEQYARDIKSASIYEGTTYIQALDLIGRKLMMAGGAVYQGWLSKVMDFTSANQTDPDFAEDFDLLQKAGGVLADYTGRLMNYFQDGRLKLIPLSATRFLECMSETIMAQLMLEQGLIARDKLKTLDPASSSGIFYRGKIETVHFFCRNILINIFSRQAALQQEDLSAVNIPEEAF